MVWALNGIAELGALTSQMSIVALRIAFNVPIESSVTP
jgi:hypothetical protein